VIELPSLGRVFTASLRRELLLGFRNRGDIANPAIFFLSVIIFVPLGISPDSTVLAGIAPGMIWIVALLATLLSLDRLFQGCLLYTSPSPRDRTRSRMPSSA